MGSFQEGAARMSNDSLIVVLVGKRRIWAKRGSDVCPRRNERCGRVQETKRPASLP